MFRKKCRLYAIVDQETCLRNHIPVSDFVKILLNSGVEIIQYRNKVDLENSVLVNFEKIYEMAGPGTTCIINDFPNIAAKFNTWCHLGQTDKNIISYKRFGRSTHSISEVQSALDELPSPDYIGFGAMFASRTKPEIAPQFHRLGEVRQLWNRDIVLIGGITLKNVETLPNDENIYFAIIRDFFTDGNQFSEIEKRTRMLVERCSRL